MSAHKLRPYLPADAEACHVIYLAAIAELAAEDYDEEALAAWAEAGGDADAFGRRLSGLLTLLAVEDGEPVGFAALKDKRVIEMLYVHPDRARTGVASTLIDALEKLAAISGTTDLSVEASDTALLFFEARGYQPQQRQSKALSDVWISNTVMTKKLGPVPMQAKQ